MNEIEWLKGADPAPMLKFGPSADRRRTARLFSCACCRRLWPLLPEESRASVAVAEHFAGGLCSRAELQAAHEGANAVVLALPNVWTYEETQFRDATGAAAECSSHLAETVGGAIGIASTAAHAIAKNAAVNAPERAFSRTRDATYAAERAVQAALVREIFGNPYCPVAFAPQWRTDTALSLARTMYEARDFSALPILADALQDAGCDSPELLTHCRSDQPHILGCWAVDLVLGRTKVEDTVARGPSGG